MLLKLDDWPALISLHADAEAWPQAFITAKRAPAHEPALQERHAAWLLQHDRFDEARRAFARSEKPHLATRILEELCYTSAVTRQLGDAAYYFYQRAMEALEVRGGCRVEREGWRRVRGM